MLTLLHDNDDFVRAVAAVALAGHQDPAVTQALLPPLHDNDDHVRIEAARALAGHQDPAVTQALLPCCMTATTSYGPRPPALWPATRTRPSPWCQEKPDRTGAAELPASGGARCCTR
jgi:hypothetical protein